jgi:succinate dehydrogenase / fumarate reductase cytochrome b subunit
MTPTTEPSADRPTSGCKHHEQLAVAPQPPKCNCQGLLKPRRLHALCGAWLACFLLVHLGISLTGWSPVAYQHNIDAIQAALAHLPGFTLLAIFVPLLAQAVSGLYLLAKHGVKYNVKKCNRGGKLRFFLQRATALALLAFALFHVGTLHAWGLHAIYQATHLSGLGRYAARGLFQPAGEAFRSTAEGFGGFCGSWTAGNFLVALLSLLGIWATAFHAANGAWSGGVVWGLAPNAEAKRRWTYAAIALGTVLLLAGTGAWYAFTLTGAARAF